jgi:hypothetical protein
MVQLKLVNLPQNALNFIAPAGLAVLVCRQMGTATDASPHPFSCCDGATISTIISRNNQSGCLERELEGMFQSKWARAQQNHLVETNWGQAKQQSTIKSEECLVV